MGTHKKSETSAVHAQIGGASRGEQDEKSVRSRLPKTSARESDAPGSKALQVEPSRRENIIGKIGLQQADRRPCRSNTARYARTRTDGEFGGSNERDGRVLARLAPGENHAKSREDDEEARGANKLATGEGCALIEGHRLR